MRLHIATWAVSAVLLGGCYPESFDSTSETGVVITAELPGYDYRQNATYVITSTISDLREFLEQDIPEGDELTHEYDAQIVARIERNLESLGYRKEPNPELRRPDVGVFLGAVRSTQWVIYYYPAWSPYWGYYPPVYYPPYPTASNYKVGTLVMAMTEIKDRKPNDVIRTVWLGSIDGMLSRSKETNVATVEQLIDQAFDQSPYLRTNNR